ncbi:hypothetical protein J421_0390 [Gemmatirosa kalamazoonensis]|uniref:Uncharacterized protein n=1 Tax=Gemmatirosa kalamazoonensis TaxID=861299 RepID=W0RBU5_9BACT|nr:hypothetical protein [Gemmatirosa kalamazoonensis]AHG87927.1 hypothetical protein J421_0390 [Gemmatirosa kalamazoonensis]
MTTVPLAGAPDYAPSAPGAPNGPNEAPPFAGTARAVFGLVDDQYAVVAHSPNLTPEAAHALCRAVSIGDPTVPIDGALSCLDVPGWGIVCTRYATLHDARGRLALVSDSVAIDRATFLALRADPFRCMPRRQELAGVDAPRALDVPRFAPSTPAAEMARLAEARRAVDEMHELRPLLAALLAGDRVLWVSPAAPLVGLLQCVVLLLPPTLRTLVTFQTAATRAPRSMPRLTGADRRYAELGTVEWTRELPREIGLADARADAAADALLALDGDALLAAHALYEDLAPATPQPRALLVEVERVARLGAHATARSRGDAAGALRAAARADDARERERLARATLAAFAPEALGAALVAVLAERSADAYALGARLVTELLREEAGADGAVASRVLDAVLGGCDRLRWAGDTAARDARAAVAVVAARRGDGERLVQLADVDASYEVGTTPWRGSAASRLTGTVVTALVHARDGDAEAAVAALDAIGALATTLAGPARRDAAGLALAVAARAVATCARAASDSGTPDRLRRLAESLLGFWARVAPGDARGEAVRWLLDDADTRALSPHDEGAAMRSLTSAPRDERAGWLGAATLRALAHGTDVGAVVAVAESLPADATLGTVLGALLGRAALDGPPLGGRWPALLAHVDVDARRVLLARSLARATTDPIALDELAATCAALADLDYRLDAAAADAAAPSLARWAATLPPTRAGAAKLGAALALLGELADADAASSLAAAVVHDAPEALRSLVQLRRLAASAAEVEATREPSAWAVRRAALRTLRRSDELLPAQRALLRAFLGAPDDARPWWRALLGRRGREDGR